jgi:hypothetical protein
MGGGRGPLLSVYVLMVFTVLVAASLTYEETASIKLAVPAQRLEANVALSSSGLAVQHVDVELTDTAQGTATGSIPITPQYATGQVEFLLVCRPTPTAPGCQTYTVPVGTVVVSVRHARYVTTSPATLLPPPGSQRGFAGIRAVALGAGGNTGAGTIMDIEGNPDLGSIGWLKVFNYSAIGGGVDAGVAQVIQQTDVDAVQVALAAKVTYELGTAMMAKAGEMMYVVDGSPTLNFALDHAVGEATQTFTLSVTGKQSAKAISESEARPILRDALRQLALPGYELADPVAGSYQFVQKDGSSDVAVSATAVGYALPNLSTPAVRARLKGMRIADAQRRLSHDFPGSSIDIRTRPLAFPWLPFVGRNIILTMVVEPAI